jgi:hypothetical protein
MDPASGREVRTAGTDLCGEGHTVTFGRSGLGGGGERAGIPMVEKVDGGAVLTG